MTPLDLIIASFVGPKSPYGKRYRFGQSRCVVRLPGLDEHRYVDRSEAMNAAASKYRPHQGNQECERRVRQMAKAVK